MKVSGVKIENRKEYYINRYSFRPDKITYLEKINKRFQEKHLMGYLESFIDDSRLKPELSLSIGVFSNIYFLDIFLTKLIFQSNLV